MNIYELSLETGRLISEMEDRVVQVKTERRSSTGFAVEEGILVTAAHTLRRGGEVRIVYPGGRERPARLLGRDHRYDLAFLEADAEVKPPEIDNGEDLKVGHFVFALGRPGNSLRAAFGMISALAGPYRLPGGGELSRYIETDGNLPSGFSGGPLMDGRGRVLGMNSSEPRGNGMTVPMKNLIASASRIREEGDITRGYLGINSVSVPVVHKEIPDRESGLMVTEVESGSPADRAGLRQGDIIYEMSGAPINDVLDLVQILASGIAGKEVNVKLLRLDLCTEFSVIPIAL